MRLLRAVFFVSIISIVCACGKKEGAKTIKLAHGLGVEHPVHKAMVYMADELARNSEGKLLIEIYPSSQLGSEQQCLELLQIGSLGMTKVSAAVMENFSPQLRIFGYPYLFKDDVQRFKVYDGEVGQKLLQAGEKYWLRGLTYFDAGNRSFYTKEKMIESPDDLKGLKIRVMQSPTAIDLVKRMGGSPTPISYGELYTALQQGVVDGAENNIPSFYSSRHYEVCKYYSLNEHSSVPDVLVISTLLWDKLSQDERGWLSDAVADATVYQRKLWKESEESALVELKKAGVEIFYPDKSQFEQRVKEMFEGLSEEDPEMYELLKEINGVN